jgi:hypothetical protein
MTQLVGFGRMLVSESEALILLWICCGVPCSEALKAVKWRKDTRKNRRLYTRFQCLLANRVWNLICDSMKSTLHTSY